MHSILKCTVGNPIAELRGWMGETKYKAGTTENQETSRLSPVFPPPVFPIASCPSPSPHKGGNSEHVRNRISRYVFVKNIGAGNVDNGPLAPLSTCWGSERVDQEFPVPQYHGCFFGCCAVCCGCCGVLLFAAKTGQGSPKEPLSPPCPA